MRAEQHQRSPECQALVLIEELQLRMLGPPLRSTVWRAMYSTCVQLPEGIHAMAASYG